MLKRKLWLWIVVATIAPSAGFPTPGDTLYVHGTVVNLREGPSTDHPVILKLNKGHKLIEISRKGKWIEVGPEKVGGKIGWIHSSLVGAQFVGSSSKALETATFRKFKAAFDELNRRVKKSTGFAFFTGAQDLGEGIIQVTATDIWLSAPKSDRESNLRTIFNMWDAAEGSGLPIAVYVVDAQGNQRMVMRRQ